MKHDHINVNAFVSIDFECFCNKYNEHFTNEYLADLTTKASV